MKGDFLRGHLDLILLAVLRSRPAYGYALIRELRRRSGGLLDLGEGTVYPALRRLEEAGHLESRLAAVGTRRRRLYSLTPAGEQELERLLEEWRQFTRGIEDLIAG